jgi:signal transduction histidine kinase
VIAHSGQHEGFMGAPVIAERHVGRRQLRGPAAASSTPTVAGIGLNLSGDVTAWNTGAEHLFGWRPDEVVGRRLPTLPADRDGRELQVQLSASPIRDASGRISGLLITLTERRQGHWSSGMGGARMEALGRLAGGVAHDFNNILTAISGYAGVIGADLSPDDPKQSDVSEIRSATERAARLTKQLMAFGRREEQEPQLIDVNDVISDVLPMLRQLIGSDIELITNATSGLPPVYADHSQLEQVLVNLILNARDAMPSGGRLVVGTGQVNLDAGFVARHPGSRAGPFVRLSVEDTGVGMDGEVLPHIFEPYFTTKEPSRGTGLGLSTAYGIVKQNDGYIWADSQLGKGTTLTVYLPAN